MHAVTLVTPAGMRGWYAMHSGPTRLGIRVPRDVEAGHVIHALRTILLDSVKQTCKDVDTEHRNEEQPCDLEGRWSKVENRIALCNPAALQERLSRQCEHRIRHVEKGA
jgi:hypothetical protein